MFVTRATPRLVTLPSGAQVTIRPVSHVEERRARKAQAEEDVARVTRGDWTLAELIADERTRPRYRLFHPATLFGFAIVAGEAPAEGSADADALARVIMRED